MTTTNSIISASTLFDNVKCSEIGFSKTAMKAAKIVYRRFETSATNNYRHAADDIRFFISRCCRKSHLGRMNSHNRR